MPPPSLAGLFYLSSGVGLSLRNLVRSATSPIPRRGRKWLALAMLLGQAQWPAPHLLLAAGLVGPFGYGVSLAACVEALRRIGTARTGAYFSPALSRHPAPPRPRMTQDRTQYGPTGIMEVVGSSRRGNCASSSRTFRLRAWPGER